VTGLVVLVSAQNFKVTCSKSNRNRLFFDLLTPRELTFDDVYSKGTLPGILSKPDLLIGFSNLTHQPRTIALDVIILTSPAFSAYVVSFLRSFADKDDPVLSPIQDILKPCKLWILQVDTYRTTTNRCLLSPLSSLVPALTLGSHWPPF